MTKETGTLAELGVQPGDVVVFVGGDATGFKIGETYDCVSGKDGFGNPAIGPINKNSGRIPTGKSELLWRIISRANQPDDKPKTFGEMTDAGKGALLLALHEGKTIQQKSRVANFGCSRR